MLMTSVRSRVRLTVASSAILTAALLAGASLRAADLRPPDTRTAPVVDTLHGVAVADPYRWLEDQAAPETRAWIESQNAYTDAVIERAPGQGPHRAPPHRAHQDRRRRPCPSSRGGRHLLQPPAGGPGAGHPLRQEGRRGGRGAGGSARAERRALDLGELPGRLAGRQAARLRRAAGRAGRGRGAPHGGGHPARGGHPAQGALLRGRHRRRQGQTSTTRASPRKGRASTATASGPRRPTRSSSARATGRRRSSASSSPETAATCSSPSSTAPPPEDRGLRAGARQGDAAAADRQRPRRRLHGRDRRRHAVPEDELERAQLARDGRGPARSRPRQVARGGAGGQVRHQRPRPRRRADLREPSRGRAAEDPGLHPGRQARARRSPCPASAPPPGIGGEWDQDEAFFSFSSFAPAADDLPLPRGQRGRRRVGAAGRARVAGRGRGAAGLLHLEGRHARADVRRPPQGPRPGRQAPDPAHRLRRLQPAAAAGVLRARRVLDRERRGLRPGQPARRRRIRRGVAPRGHAREEAERLRRLHRRRGVPDRQQLRLARHPRHLRRLATAACWWARP